MKPSLKCMSKKSAKELQELCIKAYEGQMKALQESEGEDAPLLRVLRRELHQVRAIDAVAAERESNFVF